MTTLIKYTTNTTDGNRTQTTDAATMIKRLQQCISTYEFTGGEEAICRLYFDFDYKLAPEDEYDTRTDLAFKELGEIYIREGCNSFLGIAVENIAIATSSKNNYIDCTTGDRKSKYSWRFFVPSIKMKKTEMNAFVERLNKAIRDKDSAVLEGDYGYTKDTFFDEGVYDMNRKMRCIGTSKYDDKKGINEMRPLVLTDGSLEDTLITSGLENATLATFQVPVVQSSYVSNSSNTNKRFHLVEYIISAIRKLDGCRSFGDHYPEWSKIGWTFFNECNGSHEGLIAFDSVSKKLANYDGIDAVEKVYNSGDKSHAKKLGLKWLIDLLKTNGADETVFETIASMQSNGKARFAANDDQASDLLYKEVKDIFKSCKSRLFYLDGNVWTSDNNKIDDIMLRRILQSGIYSGLNEKTGKPVSYAQNVSKATKIRDALYVKIRVQNDDPELYTKFYQNTKGLLCFKNGVLNLKTKMFTLWKDVPKHTVFTTLVIDYDYDPSPNEAAIREIKAAIFEPLFGDKMDTALHFLARAMAGHNEDKRFATYLGNRNCGKGVLYALLKNAFGDYVATFELGNIMYCRKTAGMENVDTSKKMYWALDLEGRRLVISQEVPDIKSGMMINGKMLKKITGGGDDILARRNYDRCDTLVRLVVSLFMLGNTDLVYDAEDCLEEAVEFTSVVQFKTQAEIDAMREEGRSELEMRRYRIADPDIKHKCETNDEWKRAMVALILRSYKTEKVPIIRDVSTEQNGLLSRIESIFDLTYNKNDIIPVKDIYSSLPDFDKKKIKTELNAMNIFDKKIKDGSIYRDKICFVGIKYKPIKTVPIATAVNEYPQDDEVEIIEC